MKKLLIIFSAITFLFAACNNDKTASAKEETKTTNTADDNKEDAKQPNTQSEDNSYSRKGWSAKDINDFVTSCVNEASKKGMVRAAAEKYCDCMQVGLEKMYPVANDAAMMDMNSTEVQNMVKDCLN